jgi:hypothetical protein
VADRGGWWVFWFECMGKWKGCMVSDLFFLILILTLILILLVSECDGVPTYDTCIYV